MKFRNKMIRWNKLLYCIGISMCILFSQEQFVFAQTRIMILSWNLVDSGKHMDWKADTKYLSDLKKAIVVWNEYIPGVIRKHTKSTKLDILITDIYKINGVAATTYENGSMQINLFIFDESSQKERQNCLTHEIGHALGLAHNTINDIMYYKVTKKLDLSINDKASYYHLYHCCY